MAVKASFVVSVCSAVIRRGRTDENPLCSVIDNKYPETLTTLVKYLGKVNARLNDLGYNTTMHVQQMKRDSCVDRTAGEETFMDLQIMNKLTDREQFLTNICYNTISFLRMMRMHYGMLNLLANHLNKLSDTASDADSLVSLRNTSTLVDYVMTSIQIALRSKGQHVHLRKHMSWGFIHRRYGTQRICDRQTSEYIAMLDSLRISAYLYELYKYF